MELRALAQGEFPRRWRRLRPRGRERRLQRAVKIHPCHGFEAAGPGEDVRVVGFQSKAGLGSEILRDDDLARLMDILTIPLNLEMAATDEMLDIALRHKPYAACIVPERREERS